MRNSFVGVILAIAGCGNGSSPMTGPCDLSSATPVVHSSLSGSETWSSGVHQVPSSLTVPVGATLTVAACSRVELAANVDLTVSGSLVVAGTADGPVSFVSSAAAAPWGSIHVNPGGNADLAHATLTGGGGAAPAESSGVIGAAIFVQGKGGPPVPLPLKLVSVDVEQATGVGVAMVNAGFAAGSSALIVHASGTYPVYLGADVVDTLPDGTYTGNGVDAIALQAAFAAAHGNTRAITRDLTFHNRGVPYCAGMKEPGEIVIGDVNMPTVAPLVTVEAGVGIGFPKGTSAAGRLRIVADTSTNPTTALGALAAVGTTASPIVFSSCEATAAPGDWIGLQFNGLDARTRLENVGIGNAGANSGVTGTCVTVNNMFDADAAVQILFQQGAPTASFIVGSVITGSAGNGIHRGWKGPDIDFVTGNQLSAIAWCAETLVPDLSNACPTTACMTAP